jgi:glycosyltransferase involved in cell wall biosynthesis
MQDIVSAIMFISVVLPAYNAERHLSEAIESVLRQTHEDLELILIDDGSADRTRTIMEEFGRIDARVRVVHHSNWGLVRSLNHGIEVARAEWIARMDADDVMEPSRLERQIAFLANHPSLAVAATLVSYIGSDGRVLGYSYSNLTRPGAAERIRSRDRLIHVPHPTVLMRRDTVLQIGGYRKEFRHCEDLDLWNRLADAGEEILVQPEYLLRYRIHDTSVSRISSRMDYLVLLWLEQCCWNRRRQAPEPAFHDFQASWQRMPYYRRLNYWRKYLAHEYYKRGTYHYSVGKPVRSVFNVLVSTALGPSYTPVQVWRKFVQPKLNQARARFRRRQRYPDRSTKGTNAA